MNSNNYIEIERNRELRTAFRFARLHVPRPQIKYLCGLDTCYLVGRPKPLFERLKPLFRLKFELITTNIKLWQITKFQEFGKTQTMR